MSLLTRYDFESVAGQERIITAIHKLEAKVHELQIEVHALQQQDSLIEDDLQGPEAY